jgi:hypothetical protein
MSLASNVLPITNRRHGRLKICATVNRYFGRQTSIVLVLCCWLAWTALSAAATITNVTVVNVTPSSFSVFWRAAADTTPFIAVFADGGGVTNLAGQVGIEAFPLHTGNPELAAGYERRRGRAALQQKTHSYGLMMMRVTGCRPDTAYYYRLTSTPTAGSPEVFPVSGPLPAVTTPVQNTFVPDYQQLIIDVTDLNTEGRVVLLTHTNAAYPLAAVIGDGVGTNQVFFDANDLFDLAGGGNFTPLGAQDFAANVLGPNQSDLSQHFALNFTASFEVAQATLAAVGTEFFAATVGSAIVLFGQNGAVAINGNSGVGLATINLSLDIPPGHLANFTLQALAPELNPAASTVTPQGGSSWLLHFAAQTGQSFTGNKPLGQLAFTAGPDPSSAFVPLRVTGLTATKPNASSVSQVVSESGRAVVVGAQPLLEALRSDDGSRTLMLYGRPNAAYAIEYANALSGANSWGFWVRVPMTGLSATLRPTQPVEPAIFYRAYEFQADPPVLEAQLAADGTRTLLLYGKPGASYAVEYKTNLFTAGGWQSWARVPLADSFTTLPATQTGARNIFYRAYEFVAAPPIIEALLETNRTGSVLLYGAAGRTYRLEQTANLGPLPVWTPGLQLNLTNSFSFVRGLIVTNNILFRAYSQ